MKKFVFLFSAMLALTLSHAHAINTGNPVLDAQINNDPRQLHLKKWVHGPAVDTPENYEFNVAIWDVQVAALRVHTKLRSEDEGFLEELLQACNNLLKWEERFPLIVSPIRAYVSEYMRAYVGVFISTGFAWDLNCLRRYELKGYFFDANVTGVKGQNLAERDIAAWSIALASQRGFRADELGSEFFSANPYFDEHGDQAAMYVTQRFYQDLAFLKKHNMFSNFDVFFRDHVILEHTDAVFAEVVQILNNELVILPQPFTYDRRFGRVLDFCGAYLSRKVVLNEDQKINAVHVKKILTRLFELMGPVSNITQMCLLRAYAYGLPLKLWMVELLIYDYMLAHYTNIPVWIYERAALLYKDPRIIDKRVNQEYIPYHIKSRECYEKAISLYGKKVPAFFLREAADAYSKFDALDSTEYKIECYERALALLRRVSKRVDPRNAFLFDFDGNFVIGSNSVDYKISDLIKKLDQLRECLQVEGRTAVMKRMMNPAGIFQ